MIRYLLFARILGIVVLSFTASFLMLKGFLFIPALFGFCILALSVFLYKDQQKTVKRMEYLIESIHYGDLSLFYPSDSMTEDEKALASSMNAALELSLIHICYPIDCFSGRTSTIGRVWSRSG